MLGSSSRAAPAAPSSCRAASTVLSNRSEPDLSRRQTRRRSNMSVAIRPKASASMPLRFPPQIGGVAGTSFKHEHMAAILDDCLENSRQRGFFEVHAENYM